MQIILSSPLGIYELWKVALSMHIRIQGSNRDILITTTHLKASKSEDGEEVRF